MHQLQKLLRLAVTILVYNVSWGESFTSEDVTDVLRSTAHLL